MGLPGPVMAPMNLRPLETYNISGIVAYRDEATSAFLDDVEILLGRTKVRAEIARMLGIKDESLQRRLARLGRRDLLAKMLVKSRTFNHEMLLIPWKGYQDVQRRQAG